jgi:hypothetical protein
MDFFLEFFVPREAGGIDDFGFGFGFRAWRGCGLSDSTKASLFSEPITCNYAIRWTIAALPIDASMSIAASDASRR